MLRSRSTSIRPRGGLALLPGAEAVIVALLLLAAILARPDTVAATVPAQFSDLLVADGLGAPTDIAFTPAGALYVTTQGGTLYRVDVATGAKTVALSLGGQTCANFERGLLGAVFDPNFASNNYVFLYYTFNKFANGCPYNSASSPVNRVSRFTLGGGAGSELVLVNNIPSPGGNHNAGDLAIGADGLLYIAIGDGGCDLSNSTLCGGQNNNARRKHSASGKIFRVTTSGGVPSSNPFAASGGDCRSTGSTTAGVHCRETYAWGLRNPFRIAFNAAGTSFHINDVGQGSYEEIDLGVAGADYGWSCREGLHPNPAATTTCAGTLTPPIAEYGHGSGCVSITGGAFVPSGVWPATYDGEHLYADYGCGKIFRLTGGATFASSLGAVTTLQFGPFGSTKDLYYANFNGSGQIRRIHYSGATNRPPVAEFTTDKTFGELPLTVKFDASTSSDPDGNPITYAWTYGDGGAGGNDPTVQHSYTAEQEFTATLTVTDSRGAKSTKSVTIDAGNTQPQPSISAPTSTATFNVGQRFTLTGSALDAEDGTLPDTALSWQVLLHHDTHTHPYLSETGNNIPLEAPAPEDLAAASNSYLEIILTATDSNGLTKAISQNLMPNKVQLTFASNPTGNGILIEGRRYKAPAVVTSWVGNPLDVEALDSVNAAGLAAPWSSWSDGGDQAHQILSPATATTFTASYSVDDSPTIIGAADATLTELAPTTNNGGGSSLLIQGGLSNRSEALVRFDLRALPANVDTATLYLYATEGTVDGPAVYAVDNGWSESSVTWNTKPSSLGESLDNEGRIETRTWIALDVTAAVTGNGIFSFLLTGDGTDPVTFSSTEATSRQPRLVVNAGPGDGTPPTVPTGLTLDPRASSEIVLRWTHSTDASGIASYDIFRNDVIVGISTGRTFVDNGLLAGTLYRYQVRARDTTGQVSGLSSEVSATTPAPTVTITFTPNADAYVYNKRSTQNYGSDPQLRTIGGSNIYETYIRFQPLSLAGSIHRATLRVYVSTASGSGTSDGPAVSSAGAIQWDETTLTWANRPATLAGPISDVGAMSAGKWISFDVTPFVLGNGSVTLVLAQPGSDNAIFASRESGIEPQLVITSFVDGAAVTVADIPASAPDPNAPPASPVASATETATPKPTQEPTQASSVDLPLLPFSDAFESGDLAAWQIAGAFAPSPGGGVAGSGGAIATGSSDGTGPAATLRLGNGVNELHARSGFIVDATDGQTIDILGVVDTDGVPMVSVGLTGESEVALRVERTRRTREVTRAIEGGWHDVQMHLAVVGTRGSLEIWIDGGLVYRGEVRVSNRQIGGVWLGDRKGDRSFQLRFDNVALDRGCIGSCSDQLIEIETSATATSTSTPPSTATPDATAELTPTPEATAEPTEIPTPVPTETPTALPTPAETPTIEPTATTMPEPTLEPPPAENGDASSTEPED